MMDTQFPFYHKKTFLFLIQYVQFISNNLRERREVELIQVIENEPHLIKIVIF